MVGCMYNLLLQVFAVMSTYIYVTYPSDVYVCERESVCC